MAEYPGVHSKGSEPIVINTEVRPIGGKQNLPLKSNVADKSFQKKDTDNPLKTDPVDERTQDKPSSSATRPKEGRCSFKDNLQLYIIFVTILCWLQNLCSLGLMLSLAGGISYTLVCSLLLGHM